MRRRCAHKRLQTWLAHMPKRVHGSPRLFSGNCLVLSMNTDFVWPALLSFAMVYRADEHDRALWVAPTVHAWTVDRSLTCISPNSTLQSPVYAYGRRIAPSELQDKLQHVPRNRFPRLLSLVLIRVSPCSRGSQRGLTLLFLS
ncbi:hypothetical protein PENSPDRAFT_157083 [Peniophora sp. CONT]|nr:hypothetical protein PENSPDRAFT_157083 [Peniophora sp. CONT]